MTSSGSRIGAARRRAAGVKRTAVVASAVAFLALALLARESHQANGSASSGGSGSSSGSTSQSSDDGFGFHSGSVAPSTAVPDVQSSVS
jgi:hypothetical protein